VIFLALIDRTAALFVGFCCEGLLSLFFSCVVATVDLLLSTAIVVFSVVISYLQQSAN